MVKKTVASVTTYNKMFDLEMSQEEWETTTQLRLIMPQSRCVDFSVLPPNLKELSIIDAGYISLENLESRPTLTDLRLESITLNSLHIPNELVNLRCLDIDEAYIPEITIGSKVKLSSLDISLGNPNKITMTQFGDVSNLIYVELFNVNVELPNELPKLGEMIFFQGGADLAPSIIPAGWSTAKKLYLHVKGTLLFNGSCGDFKNLWTLRLEANNGLVTILNPPASIKTIVMKGRLIMLDNNKSIEKLEVLDLCSSEGKITITDKWRSIHTLLIKAPEVTIIPSEFPLLRELRVIAKTKFTGPKVLAAPKLNSLHMTEMPFVAMDIRESTGLHRVRVLTQHGHDVKLPSDAHQLIHLNLCGVNVNDIPLELPENLGSLISLYLTGITTDITIPKTVTKLTSLQIHTEREVNIRIPRITPRLKTMLVPTNATINRY